MYDKIASDTRVYSDIQGLEQLHAEVKNNPKAAKKEVAQQFESILMQMMLKSMRDANKALASNDLFSNDQMDFYQDFFDKQMSLVMSQHGGIGFAKSIEQNISQNETPEQMAAENNISKKTPLYLQNQYNKSHAAPTVSTAKPAEVKTLAAAPAPVPLVAEPEKPFSSPKEFVKSLWASAKNAAVMLGTSPEILIAQAALETNWGKKVLPESKDASTHNLFNIKADTGWDKKTTTLDSLEQKDGVLVKEKSTFRSYDSFAESFSDYVKFLKQHNRYADALTKAANPHQFVKALQSAGFATDSGYADKILNIFSSHSFQKLVGEMK
jgi:flagellar protein FlgJ